MAIDNPDWSRATGAGGQSSTGVLTALNDALAVSCAGVAFVSFTGLGAIPGVSAVKTEGTIDGATWIPIPNLAINQNQALWGVSSLSGDLSQSEIVVATTGLSQVRLRVSSVAGGGFNFTVTARAVALAGIPLPFGQQVMASSQPVVIASDQSAVPVKIPTRPTGLLTAKWGQTSVAGAVFAIIAAVAGQTITVYHVNWDFQTAAAGVQECFLEDTTPANQLSSGRVTTAVPVFHDIDFPWGFPLAIGKGLQAHVGGGVPNVDHGGVVVYTQA